MLTGSLHARPVAGTTPSLTALTLSVLLVIVPPVLAGTGATRAWPEVPAGLEYVHRRIGDMPWAIHIVKVDRSRPAFNLTTALGQGSITGLATVRRQIEELPAESGRPLAAVNGDFFIIRPGPYQGDPTGLHVVNGELVSTSSGAAFWIDVDGNPRIGEVSTRIRITGPDGFTVQAGLNQQCAADAAVLFTPVFGPGTRTSAGNDLILEPVDSSKWLPLHVGKTVQGRIREVRHGGNAPLANNTTVLALGPGLLARLPRLPEGATLDIAISSSPDLKGVGTAIGGGPILIKDGQPRSWQGNQPRHPRTIVGYNEDAIFLVVVDGRQQGLSVGMTFPELAALMKELGCTDAINLDGGGSSTLWLGGRVMNQPSDGRERAVANSLILVERAN